MQGILLVKSLKIQMDDKKLNFGENKFSHQNLLGGSTFSAISKGQKSTPKFRKTLKTKKMRRKMFKCSKLLLFKKKNRLTW